MSLSKQVTTGSNRASNLPSLSTEENTFRVLQETLYPGSTDQEVSMILSYCNARKIDPILKPVHLVPMNVKTDKKDNEGKYIYERKNVIMPGIGLYRIDASRSGKYAGMSEPEFGEEMTVEFGDKIKKKITFPKWCKITVKKILSDGSIAEFTAKEFWMENYASKSKWDGTPNDMWEKRAYGQLAKCTEAQALRKAFPDIVGNEYTQEEMEGKIFFDEQNIKSKPRTFENGALLKKGKVDRADDVKEDIALSETVVDKRDVEKDIVDISWADDVESLKETYTSSYKYWMKFKDKTTLTRLVQAKDKRLSEIESESSKKVVINPETGEVK